MFRSFALSMGILLSVSVAAEALTVNVGNHILIANTPGQTIQLFATDILPNTVAGIQLSLSINGGGLLHGGNDGPVITAIDFDSGPTIWEPPSTPGGHTPPVISVNDGQLWQASLTTNFDFVTASSGLIATLTIDTTGWQGMHTLALTGGAITEMIGDTEFFGVEVVPATLVNGMFGDLSGPPMRIPEPNSLVLAGLGLFGFFALARQRRRS